MFPNGQSSLSRSRTTDLYLIFSFSTPSCVISVYWRVSPLRTRGSWKPTNELDAWCTCYCALCYLGYLLRGLSTYPCFPRIGMFSRVSL
jgi:hypothetical protein